MIKFEFVVEDDEALDIFDIISREQDRCRSEKYKTDNVAEQRWWDSRISYLDVLKSKMKNKQVK